MPTKHKKPVKDEWEQMFTGTTKGVAERVRKQTGRDPLVIDGIVVGAPTSVVFEQGGIRVLYRLAAEASTGRKVRRGGRKGNEKAYGTDADKAQRREELLKTVDDVRNEYPEWAVGTVDAETAKRCDCSPKTVQRARLHR